MRKLLSCIFLLFGMASSLSRHAAGNPTHEKNVLFLWWNVENLFDPANDPATDDDEFAPEGTMQWTEKRLLLKQMRLRHVLSAIEAHRDYRKYPDIWHPAFRLAGYTTGRISGRISIQCIPSV